MNVMTFAGVLWIPQLEVLRIQTLPSNQGQQQQPPLLVTILPNVLSEQHAAPVIVWLHFSLLLYTCSGPTGDSCSVCCPWIQVLLPGEQAWLVSNSHIRIIYVGEHIYCGIT